MTDYFFHDTNASSDEKLLEVNNEMKCQGLGIYWCLIELLKQNGGKMNYKPTLLAFTIRGCTADEVQQIITKYGLFEVQDGQFRSPSLLRRIEMQEESTAKKSAAASKAGKASAKARGCAADEPEEDEKTTDVQQPFNNRSTDVQPNKLINKLINKYLSLGAGAPAREREERERIFISFFFLNFKDPAREVERYWSNYAGVGWISRSGNPITDKVAYSDGWKPEQPGQRFNATALRWLKDAYAYARAHDTEAADLIPFAIHDLQVQDGTLLVVFNDKEAGAQVRTYIESNNLTGDWQQILWQARVKAKTK